MKHYTKALLGAALISSSLVSGIALAEGSTKGAVVDRNDNFVKSRLSGECVRTKWNIGTDVCAPKQEAKPTPRYIAPEPTKAKKMVTKEHKRSYITFFDYNRSALTSTAKGIVSDLFNDTKSAKSVQFELTGHADRVGSDAYNLMLSEKRALSVKNELVNLGVYSGNIRVNWKGESQPLVPTKDGIKEPQNRRTEIRVITKTTEKE